MECLLGLAVYANNHTQVKAEAPKIKAFQAIE